MKILNNLIVVLVCSAAGIAAAQGYPDKPIRAIVPSAPGGPADVIARAIGDVYAKALGQPVVFDNRSGAAGAIGTAMAAKSPPDGYTLLMTHSGPLMIEPFLNARPGYSPVKDFAPISLVGATPLLVLVNPKVPARSIRDLVDYAKANHGKLNFASGGNGTVIHLTVEMLSQAAGIKMVHVPYKGAGPGLTAIMAGEADLMVNGLSSSLTQIKAGRVRALAVTSEKRTPLAPDLPSVAESGIPLNVSGWYSLLAPAGTPKPIINKLHGELARVLSLPETRERLSGLGIDGIGSTPEQLAAHLRADLAKWEKVIKSVGLGAH